MTGDDEVLAKQRAARYLPVARWRRPWENLMATGRFLKRPAVHRVCQRS